MNYIRPLSLAWLTLIFCFALSVLWPSPSLSQSAESPPNDAASLILDQATAGMRLLSGESNADVMRLEGATGEMEALFTPQIEPEFIPAPKVRPLPAIIEVRVSISQQRMEVWVHNELVHEWPVSTARRGKTTPKGFYRPEWLSKNHRSSLYNDAPMPYAIFYSGHYAIHGTDQERKLGRPASAGCVRLSRKNAKTLFAMVQKIGKERMTVEIVD